MKVSAKIEKELETLIQTVRICSRDVGMEFGTEKYAMLILKSGEKKTVERIALLNQESIKTFGEKESYKYSGIFEADTIKQIDMK